MASRSTPVNLEVWGLSMFVLTQLEVIINTFIYSSIESICVLTLHIHV